MLRGSFAFLLANGTCAALLALMPQSAAVGMCRAELGEQLDAIATQPDLRRARLGIQVETLGRTAGERQVLYARDADRYFVPASNVKLLTTAAALRHLGPDFTTRTSVYGLDNNGLTTLYVTGGGDPTFGDEQLTDLAQQLSQQGLSRVSNLLAHDGHFPGQRVNPNWEWEDVQAGYGAPANSLMLNQNELGLTLFPQAVGQPLRVEWDDPSLTNQWRVENFSKTVSASEPEFVEIGRDLGRPILRVYGQLIVGTAPETASVAVPEPARYFAQTLRQRLTTLGVSVAQTDLTAQPIPSGASELATVTSPPLADWLSRTNRNSKNIYAEAILKSLGLAVAAAPVAEVTTAGTEAVKTVLQPLGVAPDSYEIVDGSGLSRHNLATPTAFVDTLQGMAFTPEAEIYRNSLAVAGQSGTLRNRFRDTIVQGRLHGKTGAISRNASLSGYLEPLNHPPVVLSILLNHVNQRGANLRQVIDALVLEIAQLEDC
ncbi:MAG: D-alanyl-D-alanine carboxypeptidase/D-alanyl-D-alanine-endopeptidase [Cyanobacteria bacterium P01_G01_bin.38]